MCGTFGRGDIIQFHNVMSVRLHTTKKAFQIERSARQCSLVPGIRPKMYGTAVLDSSSVENIGRTSPFRTRGTGNLSVLPPLSQLSPTKQETRTKANLIRLHQYPRIHCLSTTGRSQRRCILSWKDLDPCLNS